MKRIAFSLLVLFAIVFAVGCSGGNNSGGDADQYAELVFDNTRVHTVEVTMSEEDRADQLANPKDKTKYEADVVIDGEEIKDVCFNTKGNSSLYFMVDAGKDKYSYKINFGKYVEDQTFHGLDELNLQNNFVDASSIKESMAYWLFNRMGVDAPLSEARPMWNWILCDENYLGEYHDALLELVGVIDSGEFEEEAGRLYELILPYVEKDPKAVFTPDQFKKANATLLGFMELRADSVRRQADGQLATRSELQAEEGMVDASGISIGDMGSLEDLK